MSSFYNPSTGLPKHNVSQNSASGEAWFNPGGFYRDNSQISTSSNQYQPHATSRRWQPTNSAASTTGVEVHEANAPAAIPNLWDPAVSTAKQALEMAKVGWIPNDAAVKSYLNKILEGLIHSLRPYFAVDDRYVKKKMVKVLFPVVSKTWKRTEVKASGEEIIYALPHADENAPDLYLPIVSAVTYVLLCGLRYGISGTFEPKVLPDIMTKCLMTQSLEVLVIKYGFYTMQAPVKSLDLFSYTGYMYLGLCMSMFAGLGFGKGAYNRALLWTASATSYFVLKIYENNIPRNNATLGAKRGFIVVGFAGLQFATIWFLSETSLF